MSNYRPVIEELAYPLPQVQRPWLRRTFTAVFLVLLVLPIVTVFSVFVAAKYIVSQLVQYVKLCW